MTRDEYERQTAAAERQRRKQAERNQQVNNEDGDNAGLLSGATSLALGVAKYKAGQSVSSILSNRLGFRPVITRGLNFSASFAKQIKKSTAFDKEFGDWTIRDAKKLGRDAKTAWEKSWQKTINNRMKIDNTRIGTLAGMLRQLRVDRSNGFANRARESWTQTLINRATQKFHRGSHLMHAKFSENEVRRFENYIQDAARLKSNRERLRRAKELGLDSTDHMNIVSRINGFMDRTNKSSARKKYFQKFEDNLGQGFTDATMDIDAMEKFYGTTRTVQSTWQRIQGNSDASVRDSLKNRSRMTSNKYIIQNKDGNRETYDSLKDLDEAREYFRQMDIKDGLNLNAKKGTKEYLHYMKNSKEQRFLDLKIDKGVLRKDGYEQMYDNGDVRDLFDDFLKDFAGTLPGKILKGRDFSMARDLPSTFYAAKGSIDPGLAAMSNLAENKNSHHIDSDMMYIMGKWYRVGKDKLELSKEMEGIETEFISGEFGARKHMYHQMAGDVRIKHSDNWLRNYFDIGTDRDEFSGHSFGDFVDAHTGRDKKENYVPNAIRDILDPTIEESEVFERRVLSNGWQPSVSDTIQRNKLLERGNTLHEGLVNTTYSIDRTTAEKLMSYGVDGSAEEIFRELQYGDFDSMLNYLQGAEKDEFVLSQLNSIAEKARNDAPGLRRHIAQKEARRKENLGTDVLTGLSLFDTRPGNYTEDAEEYLRNVLTKEAFARMAKANGGDYMGVIDVINSANLEGKQRLNAVRLADLTYLEDKAALGYQGELSEDALWAQADVLHDISLRGNRFNEHLQDELQDVATEGRHLFDAVYDQADEIGNPLQYNKFVTQRKTTGIMDVMKSVNDWKKFKATTKRFGGQFFAGRDNMGEVTNATYVPYFFLSRLSDEMNKVGLGFSADNMGSTLDMAKAIAFKRVLPVAIGATYLEWADDTAEEATGMSMSGAMAQGVAEFDIAGRKVLDTLGLTDWLKGEKALNPIMQYWGGHEDFQNADERREYYEKGYDPVRKGAWWTFGGVNEARGAEIEYWEPTFVRRIQSDYKDKALYDGYFDKWSHSLLPTPSNPLSPLMGILDPYWLEEKHKDDRPYELTGHMFADGTPWGAILNPTIGDFLKPQKSLHTFLGFDYRNINGVDPKALMYAANQFIKQKARDLGHRNYIQVNGDEFAPVNLDMYDAPTPDTSVVSFQFSDGRYGTVDQGIYGAYAPDGQGAVSSFGGGDIRTKALLDDVGSEHIGFRQAIDYKLFGGPAPIQSTVLVNNGGKAGVITNQPEHVRISLEDELKIKDLLDVGGAENIYGDLAAIVHKFNPKRMMASVNQATKDKGKAAYSSPYSVDEDEVKIHGNKLKNYRPTQAMEFLEDPDTVTELLNQTKGQGVVESGAISWRLMSGIYGYALGAATGFGVDDAKRLATGQDITSFSRSFWDENLGGLGGPAAEIARRFVPDFRRGARFNPLMNDMPDWLPDRFRFGDPFAQIKKGEMRLPGKGWESLNELHPDQFGEYGAFDRFKILADIAPFTPEYKLWRDIAKKTVTDPDLIEEMNEIKDRVNQQGKKHDFYDYKIVGKGLDYKQVVVSEVLGYGKFRSGNTIYKIAGAHLRANAQESAQEVLNRYIHAGETVTVAVDADDANQQNNDTQQTVNAAVFAGGENVGQLMIKNGDASIRKGDTTAAAVLANYGPVQKMIAWGSEYIAHLDVPWLSDQFLRVRSPLESYSAEQVYGTPYQSWEHPIDSFLMPALERATHDRTAFTGMLGTMYRLTDEMGGVAPGLKRLGMAGFLLGDRGAFIGAALSQLVTGGEAETSMRWARYGSEAVTLMHAASGGNSYFDEATSMANIGDEIGRFLEKDAKGRGKYAAIGAAVGALYHGLKNPDGEWIPERTKEKWEMEDYFDRLTYLKYTGLFHAAAKKAKEEEDVDIEDVIERREEIMKKNRRGIEKYKGMVKQLQRNARESTQRTEMIQKLNAKIADLEGETMILPGGEWTRTALLYKQAADSTVYALDSNSSWSQMVTALPTNDREYFMEFVKERDPDKRKKILRTVSPALRKAFCLAWGITDPDEAMGNKAGNWILKKMPSIVQRGLGLVGIEADSYKQQSNEEFFSEHELPSSNWAGWSPEYDLKDIEVKTIKNEAMNLADFGFYDSQLRDEKVQGAPVLRYTGTTESHNEAQVEAHMKKILRGAGLKDVDISVQSGTGGTSIYAAIKTMMGARDQQKMVDDGLQMGSY